jgi:arylsulfatase
VLEGGTRPQTVYVWEHEGNRALRAGDWKLVSRLPGGWELYDIKKDRTETHDLAKEKPEKVDELEQLYHTWAQRTGIKNWVGPQTPIGREDNSIYKR